MFRAYRPYHSMIRGTILASLVLLTSCQTAVENLNDKAQGSATTASTETRPDQEGLGDVVLGAPSQSDVLQAAISTSADAILNGINLRRAQKGIAPWIIEPILVEYAYERSIDMAVRGYLDHLDPQNGEILVQRALQEQVFYGQAAEFVYATGDQLTEVSTSTLAAWFGDADHEAVLYSPDFRYAGLGIMGDGSNWIVTLIVVEGRPW